MMQDGGHVAPDFDPTRLRVATALMLMLAYSASIGGLLTPVGSPPNLIGRGLIEKATGKNRQDRRDRVAAAVAQHAPKEADDAQLGG